LGQIGFEHGQTPLLKLHLPDRVARPRFIPLRQDAIGLLVPLCDLALCGADLGRLTIFIVERPVNLLAQRGDFAVNMLTDWRLSAPRAWGRNSLDARAYQCIKFVRETFSHSAYCTVRRTGWQSAQGSGVRYNPD
jgi:hypothetical protein